MAQCTEGERKGKHGLRLFTVTCLPPQGQIKAALVFHHGLAEHVGRYKQVFSKLADSGVAVFAEDAFGHGKSEGDRAFIANFDDLVDDFLSFADAARDELMQRSGGSGVLPPMFLGGHSMGGLVAALATLRDQSRWAGLLVLSPALDVEWTLSLRIQAAVGNLLAWVAPKARIVKAVRPEDMNSDPACVQEYISDPLNTVGPLATRTANENLKAFNKLRAHYPEFTLPIYAHHGDTDKCTSMAATKRFIEAASSKDKTFNVLPGGYHEVLFGPGSDEALATMTDWILQHAAPAQKL